MPPFNPDALKPIHRRLTTLGFPINAVLGDALLAGSKRGW